MSNNSRKYLQVTLRIFLWSFTVAFDVYAKFHTCSSSFIGAQLIEVKKKRVFTNTLYLRILHCQLRQNCLGTHAKNLEIQQHLLFVIDFLRVPKCCVRLIVHLRS